MAEPTELNLWARQWRSECIAKARAQFQSYERSYRLLANKDTDYARSILAARNTALQALNVWQGSSVELPTEEAPEPAGKEQTQ